MSNEKHTPTPWKISEQSNTTISDNTGDLIMDTIGVLTGKTQMEAEANAAFIIKACNHHEKLVEALETIIASEMNDFALNGCVNAADHVDGIKDIAREVLNQLNEEK